MKKLIKHALARFPLLDGYFRRLIWSHIHFPEYEMKFLHQLPNGAFDVAIDVGAALGSYCWILNRKFAQVVAFEPGDEHHRYLDPLVRGTGIELHKLAVGSDDGEVEFFTPGADTEAYHSATASVSNPVVAAGNLTVKSVRQVALDSFWQERYGDSRALDLLKIDVEGYELEALKGARQTISVHHPLIICEIEARHNAQYQEVFRLLEALDYHCYYWKDECFNQLAGFDIEKLQLQQDLDVRLSRSFDPDRNNYINNFVFEHSKSRIKVSL
jgi:FkbM family methyltransferase